VLGSAVSVSSKALDSEIRARHRMADDGTSRLLEAAQRLIDSPLGERPDDFRPDWLTFAGGTIRQEMIVAALRSRELMAWHLGRESVLGEMAHLVRP